MKATTAGGIAIDRQQRISCQRRARPHRQRPSRRRVLSLEILETRHLLASDLFVTEGSIQSHSVSQDLAGTVELQAGTQVRLEGNLWKAIPLEYEFTPRTVLELKFSVEELGELHGLGFINGDVEAFIPSKDFFVLAGTQSAFGNRDYQNYSGSGEQTFVIPIGRHFQGASSHLVLGNDHDVPSPDASSVFRDIKIYDTISVGDYPLLSHDGDGDGSASTNPAGELTLSGDASKSLLFSYPVSSRTMLEFDLVASDVDAPLGIGWSDIATGNTDWFQLAGLDTDGLRDFSYTTPGVRQTFHIPLGEYYQGNITHLTFFNEDPATSRYSRLRLFEPEVVFGDTDAGGASIPSPYGGATQGSNGSALTAGDALQLVGNTWQAIEYHYEVNSRTMLEVDFTSVQMGELQGIGFDDNDTLDSDRFFVFAGSQSHFGIRDFQSAAVGVTQRYVIPLGQYFQGSISRLTFGNDHDVPDADAEAIFRNVRLYDEPWPEQGGASSVHLVDTCGAVGDGTHNDHLALQQCAALLPTGGEIRVPAGDFLINGAVFLGSDVRLVGVGEESRLILNTDLRSPDDPYGFWFHLGIAEKGGPGVPYRGAIQDLQFQLHASARLQAAIAIHAGNQFTIHNNVFDARQNDAEGAWTSWVHAMPTVGYRQGGSGRIQDGSIFNNVFYANHTLGSGEQISLGVGVDTLIVADNDFVGSRRSCVGVYGGSRVVIASNRCQTQQRGITVQGGQYVTVANNHLQMVPNAEGEWLLSGELISADALKPSRPTEHLVVSNNQLLVPRDARATHGIRLRGVQDGVVSDNHIEANSTTQLPGRTLDYFYGVTIEPHTAGDTEVPFESIVVQGNVLDGAAPNVIWRFGRGDYGPLTVQGNVAGGYQLYGDVLTNANRVNSDLDNPLRVEGNPSSIDTVLFEAVASPIAAGGSVLASDLLGLHEFLADQAARITRIEVFPHQPVATGRLVPTILKASGVYEPPRGGYDDSEIVFGYNTPYHSVSPNLAHDESLQIQISASDDFSSVDGTAVSSLVRVYGMLVESPPSDTAGVGSGPKLQADTLKAVGAEWRTIELDRSYRSPIVVAMIHSTPSNPPLVARIRNVESNRFELRVQPMSDASTFEPVDVSFFAVEEGVYQQADHGITLEARRGIHLTPDDGSVLQGDVQALQNVYHEPVVLGQVMTANVEQPSVFWASGLDTESPPQKGELRIGAHVGQRAGVAGTDEELAYVVFESSAGQLDGFHYVADTLRTGDQSHATSAPRRLFRPEIIVATQAGASDPDPSWAIGADVAIGARSIAVDEDQWSDAERMHGQETVAYVAFGEQLPVRHAPERLNVELCGAVGDGVTNNAAAFQNCIDLLPEGGVLHVPHGVFRVDGQIFVPSNISLAGEGPDSVLELDADLLSDDPLGYGFWWNFGLAERNTPGTFYSGEVHDLTFRLTANANTYRALEFHSADSIAIYRNYFDGSDVAHDVPISWISTQTVDAYQSAKHHKAKRHGVILNNHFVLEQTEHGGEQIGLGAFASHFVVANNIMEGNGDDCVGLHSTVSVVVAHNQCSTVDGRILVEKSVGTVVVDNQLTREPDVDGEWGPTGAFIQAHNDGSSFHGFSNSRNLVIANNRIQNPSASLATYGVWLRGVSNGVIANNDVHTASRSYVPNASTPPFMGILVQEQTSNYAHVAENIVIAGNNVHGPVETSIQMVGTGSGGPILAYDNTADVFQFYGNSWVGDSFPNLRDQPLLKLEGDSAIVEQLLFEGRVQGLGASHTEQVRDPQGNLGATLLEPRRVTRVEIIPSALPTMGRAHPVVLRADGGDYPWDLSSAVDTIMSYQYRSHYYHDGMDLEAGEFRMELLGSEELSQAIDAIVRVFGV